MSGHFKSVIFLIVCVFVSFPALSQESKFKPVTFENLYESDFCDYKIGFPEEPLISTATAPTLTNETIEQDNISFTKIYDLSKSLSVEATCRPLVAGEKEILTQKFLKKSLDAMAKQDNVIRANSAANVNEKTGDTYGLIVGSRRENPRESLITYQIWVGDDSLFFLKMESKGPEDDEKEDLFANILRNFVNKKIN